MADTKQFTEENDLLKQFMELLNQQNMGEQSQDFRKLFKYAAGMQMQLAADTESLKRRGIIKDNFDAIKPENYNLVYVGELPELSKDYTRLQTQGNVAENFKARTNERFHEISEMNPAEIEKL